MEEPVPGDAPAATRETAQSYAEAAFELEGGVWDVPLDWQPELDVALETIDCGLVKRRRASDPPDTPPFPRAEVSALTFTPEILEALASRVAAKLQPAETPPMKAGAIVSIRFRWPLFSFTRGRRRSRARG